MLRYAAVLLCAAALLTTIGQRPASAQAEPAPAKRAQMTPAEEAFAETMSGATMVGNFTVTGDESPRLRPEKYDIAEVRKLTGDLWLIQTRIRYGDNDVTLPISLPVKFAGDTAVIVVDNVGFPGLGAYSARVLVHDGKYAGYWQGANHGGHLFGEIEQSDDEDEPEASRPALDDRTEPGGEG